MRKRYRVLIFAALVAALVVPVGYALSVESTPAATPYPHYAAVPTAASVASTAAVAAVAAPIAIRTAASPSPSPAYQVPDAAKLLGIGTVLFGLAAAVRKAI
jgi:hypothetical protein